MLRDIAHGKVTNTDWQRSLAQRRRVTFWGLRKRGLIDETATGGLKLTAAVAYSLMLTDEPPADAV